MGLTMSEKRVVMVVDMQIGVFATPRINRDACVERINQLTRAADLTIFIQHTEAGGLEEGSAGFALLPELETPVNAKYVTKTACDAFYKTALEQLLREQAISHVVICGCATDYCVIPPSETVPAGVIALRLRKMPTPPHIARLHLPRR